MTAVTTGPPGPLLSPWLPGVSELVRSGFDYLDLLTAVDYPDDELIEIVVHLLDVRHGESVFARTRLDRSAPVVESLAGVLPAAAWHEREIAEMFGVTFAGHPDPGRLLLSDAISGAPLRKDVVLTERVAKPWPGAQPESGRRGKRAPRPHGVPDDGATR